MGASSDLNAASDVPDDCNVYVFYVPGMISYDELKKALLQYGGAAGKNIFVGLWDPAASALKEVMADFRIGPSPAVVIYGNPEDSTDGLLPPRYAYARIDNANILNDLQKAEDCINQTCNLFLQGNVKAAVSSARRNQFKQSMNSYLGKIFGSVEKFLENYSITIDLFKGTIIFAPSSGSESGSSK